MIEILEATTTAELDSVRGLLREYFDWILDSIEGAPAAPTFAGFDEEMGRLPHPYNRPGGRLLLARVDGEPAGCVGYVDRGAGVVELKRMYVRPAFRGRKIGRRLVTTLLGEARAAGSTKMVLDSHRSMTSAHAIYRAAGFQDVPAAADFPQDLRPYVVFMELALTG